MSSSSFALASAFAAALILPASAQTGKGSMADPAAPGSAVTVPPVSRSAMGARRGPPGAAPSGIAAKPLPKPTAAERAEKRKLDHDLNICIGC